VTTVAVTVPAVQTPFQLNLKLRKELKSKQQMLQDPNLSESERSRLINRVRVLKQELGIS
jgi:hypothetical protein